MTLTGFIIGMSFAALILVAMWALGNVGIQHHKKDATKDQFLNMANSPYLVFRALFADDVQTAKN